MHRFVLVERYADYSPSASVGVVGRVNDDIALSVVDFVEGLESSHLTRQLIEPLITGIDGCIKMWVGWPRVHRIVHSGLDEVLQ